MTEISRSSMRPEDALALVGLGNRLDHFPTQHYILLGGLALLTLAAMPVGFLVGTGLVGILVLAFESDLYRLPLVLTHAKIRHGCHGRHRFGAALGAADVAAPRPAGSCGGA